MSIGQGKIGEDYIVTFAVRNGDGTPRTGLAAGAFTVTVRDPDNSASTTATVSEIGEGAYRFTIPAAFTTTNGEGNYSASIEVTSAPRDTGVVFVQFKTRDIDDVAQPGDAMDLVTDAVDADAVATTGANEIRDTILSDATTFAGANIDAAVSSRESEVSASARAVTNQTEHDATQASIAALNDIDATGVENAVWDAARASHVGAGSFGERVNADMVQLDGNAQAATNLRRSASTIVIVTVDDAAFAPTATQFETDQTEATAEHFIGRAIVFVTGALSNQAAVITAYSLVGGRGFFTVENEGITGGGLTEAPANGDIFVIV